ncbi:MAG TPA: 2-amino-4-hydroxy-6-hydroxymethyldihydropteridine diphosphokinase [Rhodocyclaceae bacterium]|nr:MAG: 2-amino-4-hydroxy-6-hydroxymethyldihydropteridine diphosphokinase [Betaproteobacteria bacterium CG2_30_68_42]PIV72459.1 MAG: 2-amino-4-hydroxy-6-hydroxymethyldihydropteridine diphosphokinase [Rhodocyclales bacterium CG17_big_fil_post_rev_8_21_14_2_50_68_7]HCX34322.1 2-amino-4-hydroxy-6-hydroxymethyldihydropteridine diphosphokinase [Rhodocyclaceae bacterium]
MIRAAVGIGSNLGDPLATVRAALGELADLPESRLLARSSVYRSAPVGLKDQPDFINAIALIGTRLGAHALLDALFRIEARFGRRRDFRNAPRTLDLDLLLYGDRIAAGERLILPHPRMHLRAFVLAPLVEIDPGCVIPGHGPAAALLSACAGQRIERVHDPVAALAAT